MMVFRKLGAIGLLVCCMAHGVLASESMRSSSPVGRSWSKPTASRGHSFRQDCRGYLVHEDALGWHLAKDAHGTTFDGVTWCDAAFEGALEEVVLAHCGLGTSCHVNGLVQGHGVFNWVRIDKVDR